MIGRTLGHYTILAPLGAGGMGEVYRARDEKLRREVALKLLTAADTADRAARARLLREARLASALNHPHICTIYEAGEEGDQTFIAMELVEGQALSERLATGGMRTPEVLRHGVAIADALAHAHGHGVVHRDLKTSNVMVTAEGRVKVLDFGLARRLPTASGATLGISSAVTESGVMVGTVHYMAPEVLHGSDADARSDVWALGVVLYELATGQRPFEGKTAFEVTAGILNAEPMALPEAVPRGLKGVIARCLEKDPTQRYQQAAEVRAALETLRTDPTAAVAQPRGTRRAWRVPGVGIGVAAALAIVAVTAVLLFGGYRGCPGPGGRIRALAVMPMANLSGDPTQEYFADGMTDELISTLTSIAALRVISRTSIMVYKNNPKPVRDVARDLGVQAILEGAVRRSADRVKITLDLVRAAGEHRVWSATYERDLRDVLALQSDVARAVAEEIRVSLTTSERERLRHARAVNPQAHELYLLGRNQLYAPSPSPATVRKAVATFERAIQIDPGFAPAYVGLAQASYLSSNYYVPPDSAMPIVEANAKKALALDPNLAEAHSLLGVFYAAYEWRWERAEPELRRGVELNPGSADAHFIYGYWLLSAGHLQESQSELDKAVAGDPLAEFVRWINAWPAFYERRYDDSIHALLQQAERDSTLWMPYSLIGEAFELKGNLSEALAQLKKARQLGGNPWVTAALARVYAKMGRRDSTEKLLRDLEDLSRQQYVTPYGLATVQMALGRTDRAFELLDQAYEQRCEDLALAGIDPRLDPLRSDPRYADLVRRVGLDH